MSITAEAVAVYAGPLEAVAVIVHVCALVGPVKMPALVIDPHEADQFTA